MPPIHTGSDATMSVEGQAVGAPLLSVRGLQTYFMADEGVVKAVDGVSFDVSAGRTLGIVGESGCGKSVTAHSILRIVAEPGRVVGGQIMLQHEAGELDLVRLSPNGRTMRSIRSGVIGYVFQEPMSAFSLVHTIGNQIIEAIQLHRRVSKREARERGVEMLRRVGIPRPSERMDEYAFQLSGGLRQRALIAMALSCDPQLLIADEPTTALDVTTQAQILELLAELQEQTGMAIILITHNLGVVAEMADDVAVMYLGRVVEQAPVEELFYAPKHPYTQLLLKSIPSVYSERRSKLPTIAGSVPHPYSRPRGCPFHPRCPSFMPGVCDAYEPRLLTVEGQQRASCFLYQTPAVSSPRADGSVAVPFPSDAGHGPAESASRSGPDGRTG
jgi:peptide/nickel transport system ATP-binding protein